MNDGFKQRLVGAVVLVSMALIAWPLIFTDSQGPLVDKRTQIPPAPVFEKYSVAQPVKPQGLKPAPKPALAEEYAKTAQVSEEQARKLDSQGLPISWTLQVASFEDASNAAALKKRLQKKGYKAYTTEISSGSAKATRVFIGPKFNKKSLETIKADIDKPFGVESILIRYIP